MKLSERPLSLTIIGCIYMAVGIVGFVYHFQELQAGNRFHNEAVWIELTEVLAILSGAFILRGRNWARWLAFAWMAFHVIVSIGNLRAFAMHCLICAVIAWCVFRPESARYFLVAKGRTTLRR